jgi:AcrR family transcriptional regulator
VTLASLTDMNVTADRNTAQTRSRVATRERLVNSAIGLFAEHGLFGVTSHDIAKQAGVASGTFYLHFKDKAEIFRHILLETVAALRASIQQAVNASPSAAAANRARAETLVSFAENNRDLVRIMFTRDSEAASVETAVMAEMAQGLTVRLQAEQKNGDFPSDLNPAAAAQALVGMQARLIDWWTEDPSRASAAEIVHILTRLQTHGTSVTPDKPGSSQD